MTTLADVYKGSGEYLKSDDLKGADPVKAKIIDFEVGRWDDGNNRLDIKLDFGNGVVKSWAVNSTNAKRISLITGVDRTEPIEKWVGHTITLYHDPAVEYAGKLVGGIRVKLPAGEETGRKAAFLEAQAPAEPSKAKGLDDEIPF